MSLLLAFRLHPNAFFTLILYFIFYVMFCDLLWFLELLFIFGCVYDVRIILGCGWNVNLTKIQIGGLF